MSYSREYILKTRESIHFLRDKSLILRDASPEKSKEFDEWNDAARYLTNTLGILYTFLGNE